MRHLVGMRVAVAEDEPLLLHILCDILALAGAEVVDWATDIDGAQGFADSDSLDVAILDVDLKGGRVWPAASALRSKGIGVLFASGAPAQDLPRELAGVPYICKPYDYRELVEGIAAAAALPRLPAPRPQGGLQAANA
jgi:DNA-binding response OmpR family regulator